MVTAIETVIANGSVLHAGAFVGEIVCVNGDIVGQPTMGTVLNRTEDGSR